MLDSTQNTTAFDRSRSRTNLTEKSNTLILRKSTTSINDIMTPGKFSRPQTSKAKDGVSIHFDFKQALEKV